MAKPPSYSVLPKTNIPKGDLRSSLLGKTVEDERLEESDPNIVAQSYTETEILYLDADGNVVRRRPLDQQQQETVKRSNEAKKKANSRRKKKNKEKEQVPNVEFDDQSFLWDFFDRFQNLRSGGGFSVSEDVFEDEVEPSAKQFVQKRKHLYKNFLQIEDDEPLTTTNKLLAFGINAMNDVTTPELSSIVPHFRLYKVLPDEGFGPRKRIEFPFNKFTTMQSILDSNEGRGTDVGFVSVDFDDNGNHPGNTGLSFKGSMKLHFQSFQGIFKQRTVDGEKIAFADILHMQSARGKSAKKNQQTTSQESAGSTNVNCGRAPEIHMECGWSLPPEGAFRKNKKLSEQLQKLRRTYIITPIEQQIDFTDNGAVNLTIEFAAAIEGRSFSVQSDIIGVDENNIDLGLFGIAEQKAKIEKLREDIKEKKQQQIASSKNNKESSKQSANVIKQIKEDIKKINEQIKKVKSQIREQQYRRVLLYLSQRLEGRLFGIDISKESYDEYKVLLKEAAESYEQSKKEEEEQKKLTAETYQSIYSSARNSIAKRENNFSLQVGVDSSVLTSKVKENKEEKKGNSKQKPKAKPVDGTYRINYVYLGDLIEAIMGIIYENNRVIDNSMGPPRPKCPTIRTDVRLCLGSFSYVNPATGEVISIPLADVPIAMNYFNSWWYDNVIKKNRSGYPLRSFLRDFCGKLLNNVVSPRRYGGVPSRSFRFNVQSIFTKKSHPLDNEWSKGKDKKKKRIDVNKVFKKLGVGSSGQYTQWLYLYVQGGETRNSRLNGSDKEDSKRNIPHYFIGSDKGVVKNISFEKTKIPGKRESLLFKSVQEGTTNTNLLFSDRYDANLTLLGNPVFKPGMLIYIDPRALGLGISTVNPEPFMYELGVGGYYRIIKVAHTLDDSKFETKIDTISEFSTREINKQNQETLKSLQIALGK